MSKLTVEDTSLVAVADAIRAKAETTEQLTFPDGFVSAVDGLSRNYLLEFVDGRTTDITAEMLDGCTKIVKSAFYGSDITSIVIPEGVTSIGKGAFGWCQKLSSIVLPNSLETIGNSSFVRCNSLPTSMVIPERVTSIEDLAFDECSITTIEMKSSNPPTLYSMALFNSKITKIIVPAGSLSAYQSATNWSNHASKMVEATE